MVLRQLSSNKEKKKNLFNFHIIRQVGRNRILVKNHYEKITSEKSSMELKSTLNSDFEQSFYFLRINRTGTALQTKIACLEGVPTL